MRVLLLAVLVAGCSTTLIQRSYVGLPPNAWAVTFCDSTTGRIRSALDADLLRVTEDGSVAGQSTLAEVLVHEAIHRGQLGTLPKVGKCPRPITHLELVDMEIEAYCATYALALATGRDAREVGSRYARSLARQFRATLGVGVQAYIAPRWASRCPGRLLIWESS